MLTRLSLRSLESRVPVGKLPRGAILMTVLSVDALFPVFDAPS